MSQVTQSVSQKNPNAVMREISEKENVILIGADTVVTLDKQIYGKPKEYLNSPQNITYFKNLRVA